MVKIGQEVPDFSMAAYHNDDVVDLSPVSYTHLRAHETGA